MSTSTERAYSIFQTAGVYSKAAWVLNVQGGSSIAEHALLLPSMVIAALSLELYFKSLYLLENNKDFKVNGKFSHDFHALFNGLNDTVKNEIESQFAQILKGRDMKDVQMAKSLAGVTTRYDIKNNLENWSSVFVKVRYAFEKKDIPGTMMFFPEIETVLKNTIKKRKPEWFS